MTEQKVIAPKKLQEVKKLLDLMKKYNVVALAHVANMPANSLHKLRTMLRGEVVIHMTKKRLLQIALKSCGKPNLDQLGKLETGITTVLFTNMNPFTLAKYLKDKAIKGPAKPGDIAPQDIVIPAGDTKIGPGPIISDFNQHLKLPTLIKNGTIHIRTDTVTHTAGSVINEKAAQLLTRLGVEPMMIEMGLYLAWENGEVLTDEVLHVNLEAYLNRFITGVAIANGLASELPIFIPEILPFYIGKAVTKAIILDAVITGKEIARPKAAVPEAASDKKDKKEKIDKEDKDKDVEAKKSDDENMGAGISSLFD